MKALVLTPSLLFKLSGFCISDDWFSEYNLSDDFPGAKRVLVNGILFLIESTVNDDSGPLVVIDLAGDNSVFRKNTGDLKILERIITVARSVFTSSVSVPTSWRPYHEGHLRSISTNLNGDRKGRLHFDLCPNGTKDLLVFCRSDESVSFSRLSIPLSLCAEARESFADAILTESTPHVTSTSAGIILTQRLPQGFSQGSSIEQWYSSKLTNEQRLFVDKPHDGPVRLRGSAGTGKTLSLVVKFMRDAALAKGNKKEFKFGFITHSLSTVDLVTAIAESLDQSNLIHGSDENFRLEIRTLYDLAFEHLQLNLDKLQPLSLDGRDGRRMQMDLISAVVSEMASSQVLRAQYDDLSSGLSNRWLGSVHESDKRLVEEIMSEFASVLDAEGIRAGQEQGERYVRSPAGRAAWLMDLPKEVDRRFILEVHRRYRKLLGEMDALSVDQMISDFDSFLNSNRWDRIISREGYDVLFVDELHLFTSIERQTLHKLIRPTFDEVGKQNRPPIFMAYDLKQSPENSFTKYGDRDNNLFGASTGLQNSSLVMLSKVFRYTPQVADFLADIDAAFPAIDIPGEWNAYVGEAELGEGDKPELLVFPSDKKLFQHVFAAASHCAKIIEGGGRRVAVLCASAEAFDWYSDVAAGQFKGKFIKVSSRDGSSELRHAGKRFVFSMPEYVAGLQFDTVFLIHVDANEALQDSGINIRRKFISNIYLGASRAERVLRIYSSNERGGASDILNMAIQRRSLIQGALSVKNVRTEARLPQG